MFIFRQIALCKVLYTWRFNIYFVGSSPLAPHLSECVSFAPYLKLVSLPLLCWGARDPSDLWSDRVPTLSFAQKANIVKLIALNLILLYKNATSCAQVHVGWYTKTKSLGLLKYLSFAIWSSFICVVTGNCSLFNVYTFSHRAK